MVQDVMQDNETREDSKTVFTSVQHNSQLIASVRYLFFIYNKICYILSDMDNISDVNNLDVVDNSDVVIIGDF